MQNLEELIQSTYVQYAHTNNQIEGLTYVEKVEYVPT